MCRGTPENRSNQIQILFGRLSSMIARHAKPANDHYYMATQPVAMETPAHMLAMCTRPFLLLKGLGMRVGGLGGER